MAGYRPTYIAGNETGLVQGREEMLLPNDAYTNLENAYIWRERIRRRQGLKLLDRLKRIQISIKLGKTDGSGNFTGNIIAILGLEATAQIQVGSVSLTIGAVELNDNGLGVLIGTPPGPYSGSINYTTSAITVSLAPALTDIFITYNYFPGLPVMGLRQRVLNGINQIKCIAFDTKYAYQFGATGWEEFIPNVTWTGSNSQFFWSTNYFTTSGGLNIFWVTNFKDPIRFTDGLSWANFAPQIDASGNTLTNCLCMLPYRGRLVVANTIESGQQFAQRIRWAAIGTPFTVSPAPATPFNIAVPVNANAWRDDIRGQGGFLDIPTSDPIVSIGFVRDNMVVYCENTTWQLRYTGRSIAPFQIERVNSELGAKATFSTVQFDTSLIGIGDKGVVECDSYKADRIDIKIPDLVYLFSDLNVGTARVHGIRDIQQRLAYWIFPYFSGYDSELADVNKIYPNRRLVYNYENDSWAIFTDSLTCLGTIQENTSIRWEDATFPWATANFPWVATPPQFPQIIGGNQQGYTMILGGNLQPKTTNDPSLTITAITGNDTTSTVITSPDHNLVTGEVISISGIPLNTPFSTTLNNPLTRNISNAFPTNPCVINSVGHNLVTGYKVFIENVGGMVELNGNTYTITVIDADNFSLDGVDATNFTPYTSGGDWTNINAFGIEVIDANTFSLWRYSPITQAFTIPQLNLSTDIYIGGGQISVRDGFSVVSKKFNSIDSGQSVQLGYIDILFPETGSGAINLNVYMNYNNSQPVNQPDENNNPSTNQPDPVFNMTIPTAGNQSSQSIKGQKNIFRAVCPVRGQFITVEYNLSDAQLIGIEQESDVQIDAQILWMRSAGRLI